MSVLVRIETEMAWTPPKAIRYCAIAALCIVGTRSALPAEEYVVVDLRLPYPGSRYPWVFDINNRNDICGTTLLNGNPAAFVYIDGQMVALGGFGFERSAAVAINGAGDVVVNCYTNPFLQSSFLWNRGAITYIDPGLGGDYVQLINVNNTGTIIGRSAVGTNPTIWTYFSWRDGVVTTISCPSPRQVNGIGGVNDSGDLIGFCDERAARWTESGCVDLFDMLPPPLTSGNVNEINSHGDVVGWAESPTRAILWTTDQAIDLGPSSAYSINSSRQVLIYDDALGSVLWSHAVGRIVLDSLIWPLDPIQHVYGQIINDRGVIAGSGPAHHLVLVVPRSECGDLDRNALVDLQDLATLLGHFGSCLGEPSFYGPADIDGQGCIDLSDLAILLGSFGQPCPN